MKSCSKDFSDLQSVYSDIHCTCNKRLLKIDIAGIKNPIQVASRLLTEELKGPSSNGLIPPMYVLKIFKKLFLFSV